MKTKFPHLVQQKAPQEYAKICGLRSDYTLDTVSENWNIIFQQNIERQKIWRSSMGEKDGKLLYKKKHLRGLTGTKSKDVTSEKRTQFKKQGTNFEGNLRKKIEAQKFFSRKCLGKPN